MQITFFHLHLPRPLQYAGLQKAEPNSLSRKAACGMLALWVWEVTLPAALPVGSAEGAQVWQPWCQPRAACGSLQDSSAFIKETENFWLDIKQQIS